MEEEWHWVGQICGREEFGSIYREGEMAQLVKMSDQLSSKYHIYVSSNDVLMCDANIANTFLSKRTYFLFYQRVA